MKSNKKVIAAIIMILLVIIAIVALIVMSSPQKRIAKQLELAEKYVAEMDYEEAILIF